MTREQFEELVVLCQKHYTKSDYIQQVAELVAEGENVYQMCDFGEKVDGADTPEAMAILSDALFQRALNEAKEKNNYSLFMHSYEFLFCMVDSGRKNIDVKKMINSLATTPKLMFYIAGYVESDQVDKDQLKKELIESKCAKYIERWQEHFDPDGKDEELAMALEEARKEKYIPKVLEKYKGRTVSEIYEDALKSNDSNFITEVAEHVEGVNVNALFDRVLEIGDMLWIYEYMASVDSLLQQEKEKGVSFVIKKGDPKFMTYVAEFCNVADKSFDKLYDAVNSSGDKKYIEKMGTAKEKREKEAEENKLQGGDKDDR